MKRSDLSNPQIVVIAVARLGGQAQFIHTEDVAVESFNLAPGKFGWRKYPERIDLDQVRRALDRASTTKPSLLNGNARRGWMLSKEGIHWIEENLSRLPMLSGHRRGSLADAIEIERIRLRETHAWQKFQTGSTDQLNTNDLFEFARVNEYFSDAKRLERFNIISSAVDGDPELTHLWQILQEKFSSEMEKPNE
jgi:hypothetical protein